MSKFKVFILEDSKEEADYLEEKLKEFGYEVVGNAQDLMTAEKLYSSMQPNVCVVDIYLGSNRPEGVEFAKKVSSYNYKTAIVFLTGSHDSPTFFLAKSINPHSYLLKPYNPLELQYAIELAIDKTQYPAIYEADSIFVKRGNALSRISVCDIKYVEVEGKYSKIICKAEKFLIQQSLKELQSQLPSTIFSRIHRNYIVNISEVTKIDTISNEVLFKDGTSLFFSRRYLDDLLNFFKVLK